MAASIVVVVKLLFWRYSQSFLFQINFVLEISSFFRRLQSRNVIFFHRVLTWNGNWQKKNLLYCVFFLVALILSGRRHCNHSRDSHLPLTHTQLPSASAKINIIYDRAEAGEGRRSHSGMMQKEKNTSMYAFPIKCKKKLFFICWLYSSSLDLRRLAQRHRAERRCRLPSGWRFWLDRMEVQRVEMGMRLPLKPCGGRSLWLEAEPLVSLSALQQSGCVWSAHSPLAIIKQWPFFFIRRSGNVNCAAGI